MGATIAHSHRITSSAEPRVPTGGGTSSVFNLVLMRRNRARLASSPISGGPVLYSANSSGEKESHRQTRSRNAARSSFKSSKCGRLNHFAFQLSEFFFD